MAQFYAEIQGNRGPATRMGTKTSGIRGHIRGWDVGVEVYGGVSFNGDDILEIYVTYGSNQNGLSKYLGFVSLSSDGKPTFTPEDA